MEKVVIVVPIYKEFFDEFEMISICQLFKVLGRYPICFVMPFGLECKSLDQYKDAYSVIHFDNDFFLSKESYSELCMSMQFYEAFSDYEYMLIYQTDAFCFSDRLLDFCNKGYDYIGAPAPRVMWGNDGNRVGNGGFSLRKISAIRKILQKKEEIWEHIIQECDEKERKDLSIEDFFFANCKRFCDLPFSVPDVSQAFDFSVEYNIDGIYVEIEKHLPFGCHRWTTYKYPVWRRVIESYGYKLPGNNLYNMDDDSYNYQVTMLYLEDGYREQIAEFLHELLPGEKIILWGAGRIGKRSKSILTNHGFENIEVWDIGAKTMDGEVLLPDEEKILDCKHPIIITIADASQVEAELLEKGKKLRKDYYLWKDIIRQVGEIIEVDKYGERSNG